MGTPVFDRYGKPTCFAPAKTVAEAKLYIGEMLNVTQAGTKYIQLAAYWQQAEDELLIDNKRGDTFVRMRMRKGCPGQPKMANCPCVYLPSAYQPYFPWIQCGWSLPHSAREEIEQFADLATIHKTMKALNAEPPQDKALEEEIRQMNRSEAMLVRGYFNEPIATVQSNDGSFTAGTIRRELRTRTQVPLAQIKLAVEYDSLADNEQLGPLISRGAQIRFRLTTPRCSRFVEGAYASTCWDEVGWSMPWSVQEEGELRLRFNREFFQARGALVADLNRREISDRRKLGNIFTEEEDIPRHILMPYEQLVTRLAGTTYPPRKRFIYFHHVAKPDSVTARQELQAESIKVATLLTKIDPRREGRLVSFTVIPNGTEGCGCTGESILEGRLRHNEMQDMPRRAKVAGILSRIEIEWDMLQPSRDNFILDSIGGINDADDASMMEIADDSEDDSTYEDEQQDGTALEQ